MFANSVTNLKIEIRYTKSNDNLFAHDYNDVIEHPNRHICLSFRFENNKSCFFSSESLSCMVFSSYLLKLSTFTIPIFTNSRKPDIMLQTSEKKLRAFAMCIALNPDFRYDKGIIKHSGNVFCPETMCSDKFCVHKKNFPIAWKKRLSMSSMLVNVPFAQYTLQRTKQIRFSCSLVRGFIILKGREYQFKVLFRMCIVQHANTKNVLTFQLTKFLVYTTVKSARSALKCCMFPSRTEN